MRENIKVALVQSAPVYWNLAASIAKAVDLITQAAQRGAELVVFGETWLPGYPAWLDHCPAAALWDHPPTKEVFAELRRNSVVVGGKESMALADAAAANKVSVAIGINERVSEGPGQGTLYNSLLIFGADGKLLNHHRKLVPTFSEKLVWGMGDADGLRSVEASGARVGGLICWEHWMPFARQAMHTSGEHIHLALWPAVHEMHQIASRQYAFEGRCFVLAVGSLMKVSDLPQGLPPADALKNQPSRPLLNGGSCIIGPDGKYIVEPLFDQDELIIADLDLTAIERETMTLDVSGHYSRPDLFEFKVKRNLRQGKPS